MCRVPRPVTAEVFDDIFRAYEQSPALRALLRSALDRRLAAEIEPYSFITMGALDEVVNGLRLAAGDLLVDLACGRGGPGMWVAQATGARLLGVDFSTVAITQARVRVVAFELAGMADFLVGEMHATGLADARADGLMCVDSFQFAADPWAAAREVLRVLRPGGRLVLTCWEPGQLAAPNVPEAFARLDFGTLLRVAGFEQVRVAEREAWRAWERAVFERALTTDPGDDRALLRLHAEAARMAPLMPFLRRVIVTAVRPMR